MIKSWIDHHHWQFYCLKLIDLSSNFSITTATYQGKQQPDKSEADRLGRTAVGTKEDTGFTENNDRFVQTADNPARFITHYTTRYLLNSDNKKKCKFSEIKIKYVPVVQY